MLWNCYLKRGVVYLPTLGKIEKGFYRDIEPVAVVSVSDTESLRRAFQETMSRGNPKAPNLPRASHPEPAILKYAGVKSRDTFARGALSWNIEENAGIYQIIGTRESPSRGWEQDPNQIVTLPPGSSVGDVVERMISILQEAARKSALIDDAIADRPRQN